MNKRPRDNGRIYTPGNKKRTKAKIKQASHEKDKGALERFVTKSVTKNAEESFKQKCNKDVNIKCLSEEMQINHSVTIHEENQYEQQCSVNENKGELSELLQDNECFTKVKEINIEPQCSKVGNKGNLSKVIKEIQMSSKDSDSEKTENFNLNLPACLN